MINLRYAAFPCAMVAVLAVSGCDNSPSMIAPPPLSRLRAVVDGQAAIALRPDGSFQRSDPTTFGSDLLISPTRASFLAGAFVAEYGGWFESEWSDRRGGPVRAGRLKACGQIQFVDPPYDPLPAGTSLTARRVLGPRYWIRFCENDGTPLVLFSVAAIASDIQVVDGHLSPTADLFISIAASAIPAGFDVPLDAEEAAIQFGTTGGKVSEVPRLQARSDVGRFFCL